MWGEGVWRGVWEAVGTRREETKLSRVVVGLQSIVTDVRPKVFEAIYAVGDLLAACQVRGSRAGDTRIGVPGRGR